MEKQTDTRKRIASLTSNILNPFLVGLAIIVLLSFASAHNTRDALKWSAIAAAIGILPIFIAVVCLLRNGKLDEFFINVREQRTKIYILGFLCASASCATLACLNAPSMLVAGFTTGLSTTFIFALINLWWKISLHTAIVAATATMLVLLYGWMAAATVALVPLTAWSRIELKYHSVAQAISGAALAALLVVVMFYPLAQAWGNTI
jgi:hypothetical protein